MRYKLITAEIVLLLVAIVIYWVGGGPATTAGDVEDAGNQPAIADLPVQNIHRIEITRGEEQMVFKKQTSGDSENESSGENAQQQKEEGKKGFFSPETRGDWLLESYHNYRVKEDLVKDRILDPLRELKKGQIRSHNRESLDRFGLDESSATHIVLKTSEDEVIREIYLGNEDSGFKEVGKPKFGDEEKEGKPEVGRFYYFPAENEEEFEVRLGQVDFPDVETDPQDWIYRGIMEFTESDVNCIAIRKGNQLSILYRKQKAPSEDGDGDGEENGNRSGSEEDSAVDEGPEFTDWTLKTGSVYRPIQIQTEYRKFSKSNFGKEKSVKQFRADQVFNTLKKLEAKKVMPPFKIPRSMKRVPKAKLKTRGLDKPVAVVYLGIWAPRPQAVAFWDRLFIGKVGGDDSGKKKKDKKDSGKYYTSRLLRQTDMEVLGGVFGSQQTIYRIPVYLMKNSNFNKVGKPEDLVQENKTKDDGKEEEKKTEQTPDEESGDTGNQESDKPTEKKSESGDSSNGNSNQEKGASDDDTGNGKQGSDPSSGSGSTGSSKD